MNCNLSDSTSDEEEDYEYDDKKEPFTFVTWLRS
jgi:hypothetical protein